jgi:hypothetical protein
MGERPGVKIVADLANKLAVRTKLQELRGGCSIGWSGRVSAGKDKDVPFGVDGDARHFAEIQVGRKLEKIRNGTIADLGDWGLLCTKATGSQKEKKST